MKRTNLRRFEDTSLLLQWINRTADVLFLIPLCVIGGNALAALVPFVILHQFLVDVFCVTLPFAFSDAFSYLLARHKKRAFFSAYRALMIMMLVTGVTVGLIVALAADPLAHWMLGSSAPAADYQLFTYGFYGIALLLPIECILSVYHSIDHCGQNKKFFVFSIILTQVLRVIGGIVTALVVYQKEISDPLRIWIVILLCLVPALILLVVEVVRAGGLFPRNMPHSEGSLSLFLSRSISSFLSLVMHNLYLLFDVFAAIPLALYCGMDYNNALCAYGVFYIGSLMLSLIPLLFTFHLANNSLVPLEKALSKGDGDRIEQQVTAAFNRSLKIIIPFGIFLFLHGDVVARCLLGFMNGGTGTVYIALGGLYAILYGACVFSSLMMDALHLKGKKNSYWLAGFVFKAVLVYPLAKQAGMQGIILSDIICLFVILFLNLARIKNKALVEYKRTAVVLFRIILSTFAMHGAIYALSLVGITGMVENLNEACMHLGMMVAAGSVAYYMTGDILRIFYFGGKR